MNLFEELRADHDIQRRLVGILAKTSGDSQGRRELFQRLRDSLERHARAEERSLYIPMMDRDLTQEKARHSVAEHKELDDYIEQLEATDRSSPAWLSVARKLEHRLVHHLEEEEREVFQLAGKILTDNQKLTLAAEYRALMDQER